MKGGIVHKYTGCLGLEVDIESSLRRQRNGELLGNNLHQIDEGRNLNSLCPKNYYIVSFSELFQMDDGQNINSLCDDGIVKDFVLEP